MSIKFYREFVPGKYKYTETFNSTLDPEYHRLINELDKDATSWYVKDASGNITHKSQCYEKAKNSIGM